MDAVILLMRLFILPTILLGLIACSDPTPGKKYISIPSLIEQQIKHVDTSLYSIQQLIAQDTLPADTNYVPREDFRQHASAFLSIPDLSDPKQANLFNEEIRYDDLLKRVIISYTPATPGKTEFQRIELFVEPNLATGDQVKTILATRRKGDRDGFEQDEFVWQMDRSCTRIRTTRKPAAAEQTTTYKLSWND